MPAPPQTADTRCSWSGLCRSPASPGMTATPPRESTRIPAPRQTDGIVLVYGPAIPVHAHIHIPPVSRPPTRRDSRYNSLQQLPTRSRVLVFQRAALESCLCRAPVAPRHTQPLQPLPRTHALIHQAQTGTSPHRRLTVGATSTCAFAASLVLTFEFHRVRPDVLRGETCAIPRCVVRMSVSPHHEARPPAQVPTAGFLIWRSGGVRSHTVHSLPSSRRSRRACHTLASSSSFQPSSVLNDARTPHPRLLADARLWAWGVHLSGSTRLICRSSVARPPGAEVFDTECFPLGSKLGLLITGAKKAWANVAIGVCKE
eukprot:1177353-Prorocentrum_minimum.AAC.1